MEGSSKEAVEKVASDEKTTADERSSATAWFLEADAEDDFTSSFQLNVGVSEEKWITWTVRPVDRDTIDKLRKTYREKDGEVDASAVNLRIAVEGTVDPDLMSPAIRGKYADPGDALRFRFRHKSGLIDQIANKVVEISGYDDTDVREVEAAKN